MKYLLIAISLLLSPLIIQAQIITTFAGNGSSGSNIGDGGPATTAVLGDPTGGAFDKYGNYFIACAIGGNYIRRITPAGIITTIAGTGSSGFNGDGIPATTAKLGLPTCVIVDTVGNLYIADGQNNRIRKVDIVTGIITTIAGNGTAGYSGDNGPATNAKLNIPCDICFDKYGNLYIADYSNARVRKVNTSGIINTFAGNGIPGYSGDGSRADTGRIGGISGVATDHLGNIYLADISLSRVFKVNTSGIITTVAGTTTGYLYNGDNMPATNANIDPTKIKIDNYGNLYIAEHQNYRVRRVAANGYIYTEAGLGSSGFSGDGGSATTAQLSYPSGITLDSCGNLYISEANNNRIRKVTYAKCHQLDASEMQEQGTAPFIYPNPINDILHIDGINHLTNYRLISIVGASLQQGSLKSGSNIVSMATLPPGIYLLELADDNKRTITKILKQ